ncbi:MAG: NYN domain-containing protein [Proteobacteria bacterium]|nr:NYN domain-containing protein [Pseudomonadota bacterium]
MTFKETKIPTPFKANIFIDWVNVKLNGGFGLDFFKMMQHIRDKGGIILRANIYAPEPDDNQISFYDAMKSAGLKLILINEKYDNVNSDALMAVDMVTQSHDVDVIYILTNDADFVPAVLYLQSIGKRVLLLHADEPSNELRKTVDERRHLDQLKLLREQH